MNSRASHASQRTGTARALAAASLLLVLHAGTATARNRIFVSGWGDDPANGHVFLLDDSGTWIDLGLPAPDVEAVRDLEWIGDELWATAGWWADGGVFRHDGTAWHRMSEPGFFEGAVSTLTLIEGDVLATDIVHGLFRWEGGTTWVPLGEADGMAQAEVVPAPDGRPLLLIGSEWEDAFWAFDPAGLLECGAACPDAGGVVCPAECYPGSCIYAMAVHDDGSGPTAYAGADAGLVYAWFPAVNRFEPGFDLGLGGININAMAAWQGRLYVGLDDGTLLSTVSGGASTRLEPTPMPGVPITRMAVDNESGLLWIGLGTALFGPQHPGAMSTIVTFDGATFSERALPGTFGDGVAAILVAPPAVSIACDAGGDRLIECAGPQTEVTLDGSGTQIDGPPGLVADYAWSGPFLEGVAAGPSPVVHFAGVGEYDVVLTVTADDVVASCSAHVSIVDLTPPVIAAGAGDLACAWPPNHRMVSLGRAELSAFVTDACDEEPSWWLADCASDQPDDGRGDGNSEPDCVVAADGSSVSVRAERQGGLPDGRRYAVTARAVDAEGNVSAPTTIGFVHVPHDGAIASGGCPSAR